MLRIASSIVVLGLLVAACDDASPPTGGPGGAAERPALADVLDQHREASLAVFGHIRAVLAHAVTLPLLEPSQLDALSMSLPVSDIVLNTGSGTDRPGNARASTLRELAGAPEIIRDVPGYYDFLSSQTWATLGVDAATYGQLRGAYQAVTEENPEGQASGSLIATLEELPRLQYFILVRQVRYLAPAVGANRTFTPGHFIGDILVYNLPNERLIGQLRLIGQSSSEVTNVSEDLATNTRAAFRAVLEAAQENVDSHVPPASTLSPAERRSQACAAGDIEACTAWGHMLWDGDGVAADRVAATTAYRTGCAGGNGLACMRAAGALFNGEDGVVQDKAEAIQLYGRACELDQAEGCNVFGAAYRDGHQVTQDAARARQLFDRACAGGSTNGCSQLGMLLVTENGGPTDFAGARRALTTACSVDHHSACMILGMIEQFGSDGPVNLERARELYRTACDGGVQDACNRLQGLAP